MLPRGSRRVELEGMHGEIVVRLASAQQCLREPADGIILR